MVPVPVPWNGTAPAGVVPHGCAEGIECLQSLHKGHWWVGGWGGSGGGGGGCGRYRVAQADACLSADWHWYRGTGSSSTVPRYRAGGVVPWVCGGYRVLAIVIQRTLVGGEGLWSVQGPVITLVYARYQLRVEPWNRGTAFHGAPTVHRRWILV